MRRWPEAWLWWLGAALIFVTNAVALGGAAFNRNGQPQAVLTLTERELALPWPSWRLQEEDSGLDLMLRWSVARDITSDEDLNSYRYGRTAPWLDAQRLSALGFPLIPPTEEWSWKQRRRLQPREVFLVLELDGAAHARYLAAMDEHTAKERAQAEAETDAEKRKRQLESIERTVKEAHEHATRLYAIDAGLDAAALRATYPDTAKFIVVRGQVRPEWQGMQDSGKYSGWIESINVESLHVPTALLPVFDGLNPSGEPRQRGYRVEVAWGRRAEPWIQAAVRHP